MTNFQSTPVPTQHMGKTHKAALVLIPPENVWAPIQSIRERLDRNFRRWMPHVTLLYPFRPFDEFGDLVAPLTEAARAVQPFDVELGIFNWFRHGRDRFTLWLDPRPTEPWTHLQSTLQQVAPDCDDVQRFPSGYTPHLSVGQVRGSAEDAAHGLQSNWEPIRFRVESVHLIHRDDPPNDVFRVDHSIPLG